MRHQPQARLYAWPWRYREGLEMVLCKAETCYTRLLLDSSLSLRISPPTQERAILLDAHHVQTYSWPWALSSHQGKRKWPFPQHKVGLCIFQRSRVDVASGEQVSPLELGLWPCRAGAEGAAQNPCISSEEHIGREQSQILWQLYRRVGDSLTDTSERLMWTEECGNKRQVEGQRGRRYGCW